LTWDRVNVATGGIHLEAAHSKNEKARTAYLRPETVPLLAEQRDRVELVQNATNQIIQHVFPHVGEGELQGQPVRGFKKAWKAGSRNAGYAGLLLHDLRRSGIRAMVWAGTPDSVATKVSRARDQERVREIRHLLRAGLDGRHRA
jgi:integrase